MPAYVRASDRQAARSRLSTEYGDLVGSRAVDLQVATLAQGQVVGGLVVLALVGNVVGPLAPPGSAVRAASWVLVALVVVGGVVAMTTAVRTGRAAARYVRETSGRQVRLLGLGRDRAAVLRSIERSGAYFDRRAKTRGSDPDQRHL